MAGALVGSSLAVLATTPAPASALTTAIQVSGGGQTSCEVVTGGAAYCWGDNGSGQFGDGTTNSSATPVLVSGAHTWASISTVDSLDQGGNQMAVTCGVTTAGAGYCWGDGWDDTIGDGFSAQRLTPTLVSGSHTWRSISVGRGDVCGVTTSNVGYCWGDNGYGEDGDNNAGTSNSTPALVSGGYSWSQISAGDWFTCGITTANVGYCWGYNFYGEQGNGGTANSAIPVAISGAYTWAQISASAAGEDTCGVTTTGVGYCWGANYGGEIGTGSWGSSHVPAAVTGSHTWSQIQVGGANSCGLTTSGVTYCWGIEGVGEVGDGATGGNQLAPVLVSGGLTFSSIVVGPDGTDDTNCGLTSLGILYCWGNNDVSQIGDGTTTDRDVPTQASELYGGDANTNLSVTIIPSFTFTVGNRSSTCDGESNFVSSAGSANAVALGNLAAGANVSGGQALTVAGNSGGGFVVYVAGTQVSQNLRGGGHNWVDVAGSYASPASLGGGEQFGYTYHDATASSSVSNPSAANFIALTNVNEAVMGSNSSTSGAGCVSYDAQASASTPAASYTATIIYTAVPAF